MDNGGWIFGLTSYYVGTTRIQRNGYVQEPYVPHAWLQWYHDVGDAENAQELG